MRRSTLFLLGALAALSHGATHADTYLIVHSANPVRTLTQQQAQELFMGRIRQFAHGDHALVFDLPRDSAERASFYRTLTGMEPAQVNSYWARLIFTGQTMPPQPLPSEAAMLDVIKRNPSAIGYLSRPPGDAGVRVVLVLRDGARDGPARPDPAP